MSTAPIPYLLRQLLGEERWPEIKLYYSSNSAAPGNKSDHAATSEEAETVAELYKKFAKHGVQNLDKENNDSYIKEGSISSRKSLSDRIKRLYEGAPDESSSEEQASLHETESGCKRRRGRSESEESEISEKRKSRESLLSPNRKQADLNFNDEEDFIAQDTSEYETASEFEGSRQKGKGRRLSDDVRRRSDSHNTDYEEEQRARRAPSSNIRRHMLTETDLEDEGDRDFDGKSVMSETESERKTQTARKRRERISWSKENEIVHKEDEDIEEISIPIETESEKATRISRQRKQQRIDRQNKNQSQSEEEHKSTDKGGEESVSSENESEKAMRLAKERRQERQKKTVTPDTDDDSYQESGTEIEEDLIPSETESKKATRIARERRQLNIDRQEENEMQSEEEQKSSDEEKEKSSQNENESVRIAKERTLLRRKETEIDSTEDDIYEESSTELEDELIPSEPESEKATRIAREKRRQNFYADQVNESHNEVEQASADVLNGEEREEETIPIESEIKKAAQIAREKRWRKARRDIEELVSKIFCTVQFPINHIQYGLFEEYWVQESTKVPLPSSLQCKHSVDHETWPDNWLCHVTMMLLMTNLK